MYKKYLKRILDFKVSFIGILLLSPVLIIITIILSISNSGAAFFVQERPGLNEKIFKIIKFKTMNDKKDAQGDFLSDSERITSIGNFIRKFSLDEIPQLFNVLVGDMSLIGPRPLLPQYLPLYNDFQKQRHNAKPGITGWAQINGRNAISWEQKFEYDVWYVNNISLVLDFKILRLTVLKVLKNENVNQSNGRTMKTFNGKQN